MSKAVQHHQQDHHDAHDFLPEILSFDVVVVVLIVTAVTEVVPSSPLGGNDVKINEVAETKVENNLYFFADKPITIPAVVRDAKPSRNIFQETNG